MTDIDRLAEANYASRDPEFDNSELEEAPTFEDEEWTEVVEDAWKVTQSINHLVNYADSVKDIVLLKELKVLSRRFTIMKGDMQL